MTKVGLLHKLQVTLAETVLYAFQCKNDNKENQRVHGLQNFLVQGGNKFAPEIVRFPYHLARDVFGEGTAAANEAVDTHGR